MYWTLFCCMILISSVIAFQDFRQRAVSWFLFPIFGLCGCFLSYFTLGSFSIVLGHITFNSLFLILQYLLLKGFFILRHSSHIINSKIGLGDILFLLSATCYFSFLNYVSFYIFSLLFSLIAYLLVCRIKSSANDQQHTIPLAGLQSVFIILYIGLSALLNNSIVVDDWLLNKLSKI
jgi:hypothetical protein